MHSIGVAYRSLALYSIAITVSLDTQRLPRVSQTLGLGYRLLLADMMQKRELRIGARDTV